jgi:hypothetical protein
MSQDYKIVGNRDVSKKNILTDPHKRTGDEMQPMHTALSQHSASMQMSADSEGSDALHGIGQQGGKIYVEGGGGFKAATSSSSKSSYGAYPTAKVTIMSFEVHVQCRTGKAGANDSTDISMQPDPTRDATFAVCYVMVSILVEEKKFKSLSEDAFLFRPKKIPVSIKLKLVRMDQEWTLYH